MNAHSSKKTAQIHKAMRRLAYWTFAWLITLAITAFGAKLLWNFDTRISIFFILLNAAVGIGMIMANAKYLQEVDEMQRKIMMDAMGLALGVGLIGGLSYSMLDATNVIASDAEIAYIIMLMGFTYLIGVYKSTIRYQ